MESAKEPVAMSEGKIIAEQDATFQAEDKEQPIPPTDIVAYNELRSCADLVRMHANGKLEIQPEFQRDFIWKQDEQSRFIDSLVKQLPIPSMCFSLDYKTQKWKVIDGLQRMSCVIKFLSEKDWRLSNLGDIHPRLRNASNLELKKGDEDARRLYALVEDVSIPITVIRCDYTQLSNMRYLFTIFHRLNSGGVRLTNQEIRNCIFSGSFNNMLKKLDKDDGAWKIVKRRIWGATDRYRSVEILLRSLAFVDFMKKTSTYDGNLARFLNDYMHDHVNPPEEELARTRSLLQRAVLLTNEMLTTEGKRKLPLAQVEAILVGLLSKGEIILSLPVETVKEKYAVLKGKPIFSTGARYGVTNPVNVETRLREAIDVFA